MSSKIHLLCLTLLCCSLQLNAQELNETYHRVRIRLEGKNIQEISALGLETDHGEYVPGRHITNDFSAHELRLLDENGFGYEILIEDVVDYYQSPERRASEQNGARGGTLCEDNNSVKQATWCLRW